MLFPQKTHFVNAFVGLSRYFFLEQIPHTPDVVKHFLNYTTSGLKTSTYTPCGLNSSGQHMEMVFTNGDSTICTPIIQYALDFNDMRP